MKKKGFLGFTAFLASCFMTSNMTAMAEPIPIEYFAKHPAISDVTISSNGKYIAGLLAVEGERWPVLSIWDADDLAKPPVWIPTKKMRYRGIKFLGNNKILFIADQPLTVKRKDSHTHKIYMVDVNGKNIVELLEDEKKTQDAERSFISVFNENLSNDDFILLSKLDLEKDMEEIFLVNIATGKTRKMEEAGKDFSYIPALVNPITGELLGKQKIEVVDGEIWSKTYIRENEKADWVYHPKLSSRAQDFNLIKIEGYNGSLDKIVVISDVGNQFAKAYEYNISTQKFTPSPIYEHAQFNVDSVLFSHKGIPAPVGVRVGGSFVHTVYFDKYWNEIHLKLENTFPDKNVVIRDRLDNKMAIVVVSDERTPPSYLLFKDGSLEPLGSERPWIEPDDIGISLWVHYRARDGLEIPAILSVPPNYDRSQGRIPAIIFPHFDPWGRDVINWDSSGWVPFFTSRGIAVIQPQYRGTRGLGRKLFMAGQDEWGKKMQDDKDDAAAWLVRQDIADPDKIAIYGYSYGGYAAMAATVREGSPYKCAIAGAGVSRLEDLGSLWRTGAEREIKDFKGLDPMANIENANIPIFLYHGAGDRQVDTEQSRSFYKAMKKARKDVEYLEITNMWHEFPWWPEWYREALRETEKYLKSLKCNGILN